MNAYVVRTREMREPLMDDGSGPSFPIWPIAPVVAETPAQAKQLFLREYAHSRRSSGVETDDYPNLRVRLLEREVELEEGVYEENNDLWRRVHEIEDHAGAPCDCFVGPDDPDWPW